ncbi:hypothetical protein SNOG_02342 [Parastagonospora nodorum SN15]|uniref:Uncharacterized protein n=1 Tax=Phaeosphaeria nodorum (strain SN15 / ATCC MYA-4574 / FGSC 10173) TaxID=321614 RepID=Q0V0X2_PHANO|nr:hypothetical protein SNOG_02342 [Parastagonospora nodorum SN15]EAT90554.1 hypothetical protein SNOG_02342 [Parastagonospora nodorum SN15]
MRPISTNNDSSRHEQQQRPPIPRRVLQDERQYSTVDDRILNRYIFAIMTPLRQTRERSSRDSICDAMTLTSDEYETLYAEVEREMRERAILYSEGGCVTTEQPAAKYGARQSPTYNHALSMSDVITMQHDGCAPSDAKCDVTIILRLGCGTMMDMLRLWSTVPDSLTP